MTQHVSWTGHVVLSSHRVASGSPGIEHAIFLSQMAGTPQLVSLSSALWAIATVELIKELVPICHRQGSDECVHKSSQLASYVGTCV